MICAEFQSLRYYILLGADASLVIISFNEKSYLNTDVKISTTLQQNPAEVQDASLFVIICDGIINGVISSMPVIRPWFKSTIQHRTLALLQITLAVF